MISVTVPVQWDDLTGLNTNKGVRERLHEQRDLWLDLLDEEMEMEEGKLDVLVKPKDVEARGALRRSYIEKYTRNKDSTEEEDWVKDLSEMPRNGH